MYIALIYSILIICAVLCFIEEYTHKYNILMYITIGMMLVMVAAFRPVGMDNDYDNYYTSFMRYDDPTLEMSQEWSFRIISRIVYLLTHEFGVLLLIYAIMGVSVKMFAIRSLTPLYFAPLCVYIGNFFVLQEFTQIRAGVSAGFILMSISPIYNKEYLKAILFLGCAIFFHYSAVVALPLLFFSTKDLKGWRAYAWAGIVPLAYIIHILHISITSLPIPYVEEKLDTYEALRDIGFIDEANVFNAVMLVKVAMYMYLLYFYDVIKEHIPCLSIMLKMLGLSIFCFVAFTDLPVLSFRLSDLFGVVEIILYSSIIYTIRPAMVGKVAVAVIGLAYLSLSVFYNGILQIM